jgi:ankyrin repeat protein
MCKVLIENGCDLSIQDSNGKMASYFARKNTKQEVYDYLTA